MVLGYYIFITKSLNGLGFNSVILYLFEYRAPRCYLSMSILLSIYLTICLSDYSYICLSSICLYVYLSLPGVNKFISVTIPRRPTLQVDPVQNFNLEQVKISVPHLIHNLNKKIIKCVCKVISHKRLNRSPQNLQRNFIFDYLTNLLFWKTGINFIISI